MSAWSQLPNAHHIDRILESLKKHHDIWTAARYAGRNAAWHAALDAAWYAARVAAWHAALDAARAAGRVAAVDAIIALIAWDDSAQFLELSSDKLEVWARISDDPRAILLLPAVRVFERIKTLETV